MSRVLNVTPEELQRASLPAISAATARRSPRVDIVTEEVELIKLDSTWFFTAVFLGPVMFTLILATLPRRRLRLPLEPEERIAAAERLARGLGWLRAGLVAWAGLAAIPAAFWNTSAAALCLVVGGIGWAAGLVGTARLCQAARRLPALLEVFDLGRVAVELPSWWVADEYRKALGHAPQGQPKGEVDQAGEDAVWDARGKPATWDEAPPPGDPPGAT